MAVSFHPVCAAWKAAGGGSAGQEPVVYVVVVGRWRCCGCGGGGVPARKQVWYHAMFTVRAERQMRQAGARCGGARWARVAPGQVGQNVRRVWQCCRTTVAPPGGGAGPGQVGQRHRWGKVWCGGRMGAKQQHGGRRQGGGGGCGRQAPPCWAGRLGGTVLQVAGVRWGKAVPAGRRGATGRRGHASVTCRCAARQAARG